MRERNSAPLHAHVSVESHDCDGRYSRTFILESDPGETESDFKASIRALCPEWMPTDEGFVAHEIEWCTDNDTDTRGTFRDHSAEAAGY